MGSLTPDEVHSWLAGLALANELEVEELRNAPIELKLRQTWTLMSAADLFERAAQREAESRQVRERWDRLYRAFHA